MEQEYSRFFKVFAKVSKAIHCGENTTDILESIVSNIAEILSAKGCIFWIVDTAQKNIKNKISYGFSYRNLMEIQYDTLMKIFERQSDDFIFIEDAVADQRIPNLDRIGKKRVSSISALFVDIVGNYRGILAVYFTNKQKLTQSEEEIVRALGDQAAIALQKNFSFDEKMLSSFRQMVEGFTLALEAKDQQTHGHSIKVAEFAKLVAEELNLTDSEVETIYHGGLLHDIGKIGMDDSILERLGILSRKEMDVVKQHPIIGARITQPLVFLSDVEPLIRHHHERYDGTGYPDGLKGKDIPLGARILTVCDAFETMIAGRRHFEKMRLDDAIVNLQLGAGSQFDSHIVLALFSLIEKNPELVGVNNSIKSSIAIHKRNLNNRMKARTASLFI